MSQSIPREGTETLICLKLTYFRNVAIHTPRGDGNLCSCVLLGKKQYVAIHTPRGDGNLTPLTIPVNEVMSQSIPREGTETPVRSTETRLASSRNPYPARGRKLVFSATYLVLVYQVAIHTPRGDGNSKCSSSYTTQVTVAIHTPRGDGN
mgnify:CR=1 FL=1